MRGTKRGGQPRTTRHAPRTIARSLVPMPEESPPTGWRAWFPSFEERAARRQARIEELAKTDTIRARIEIVIGVVAIVGIVAVIVINVIR